MHPRAHIDICEKLDPAKAYAFVDDAAHGAVTSFIGVVRNHHEGKKVSAINYDVHEDLAKETLTNICAEALNYWDDVHIFVEHAKGELQVGGISVVIAVSSAHRAATFEACRYIIEEIKKRAAIWKKEHYAEGDTAWLSGQQLQQTISKSDSCGCGGCGCGGK